MKLQTTYPQPLMPFCARPVKSISRLFPNMKTPMIKKITSLCLVLAAGVIATRADSLNWDQLGSGTLGGTGTWDLNTTANWYNGSTDVKWTDNSALGTNSAVFSGATAGTVTLNTSLSASNLQFTTTGYTLSGSGTLTLGAGGIDASTLGSGTTTIGNALSLSGGQQLWQVGGGTLAINGAVTRSTGAAVDFSASGVTSSTLANDAGGIIGGWATVNGVSGSGGDWAAVSGGNVSAYSGYTAVTGNQSGSGASALNWQNGGGGVTLTANATINSLNELNDFTINSGVTCTLGSGGLLMAGNTSRWFMGNAGFLTSGAGNGELDVYVPGGTDNNWTIWAIIKDNGATPVTLVKNSTGLLIVGNQNTYTGGTVVNAGTLGYSGTARYGNGSDASGAVTPFGTGPITMNSGTLFNLGVNIGLGGSTSGHNTLTYNIPNAVTVNGATIFESDGFMHLQGALTIGAGGATLGATWNGGGGDVNKGLFIDGVVSGSGNLTLRQTGFATGNVWNTSIVYFGNTNTYSGTITVVPMSSGNGGSYVGNNSSLALQNATLDLSGGNNSNQQFGSSPLVFATGIGSATLGALVGSANVVLTGYNETTHAYGSDAIALSIGNNNTSTTYSGIISGGGSLTKIGSGTLTLSGANTYTGNTTISAGTLALTGASVSSANINVARGATFDVSGISLTLGGSQVLYGGGTNIGSVNTTSGSKIYAGTDGGYGTNVCNNDLSLASGAVAYMDVGTLATGSNDLITVAGTLTLNNNVLHLKAPSISANLQAADYTLFTSPNTISGSFAGITWDVQPANAGHYSVVTGANTVTLHYTASTAPAAIGSASPSPAVRNQTVLVTVTATNGNAGTVNGVTVDASPVGGSSLTLVEAGSSGNVSVWTNSVTVTPDTLAGGKTLVATVTAPSSPSATVNIPLTVVVGNDVWNGAGTGNNFSTAMNWTNKLAPGYVGDTLEFAAGVTDLTPNVDNAYTVPGITFDSGAGSYNIGGNTLTLSGSGSLVNNSANPQTLNVPLADFGGGITKTGNGLLTLAAVNTYTGPTLVNAGTLSVSGSVSGADMTVAGQAGNAALTVSGSLGGGTNTMAVGTVTNAVGALWQTGGTISLGTGTAFFGHLPGAYGYGRIDSGMLSMTELQLGSWGSTGGNGGNALFEVNGGTVTDTGWLVMARGGAAQTGELNVYSGSLSFAGGGLVNNWGSGQTSIINVLGGSLATTANNEIGFLNGTGIVNLLGGVATVNAINGAWGSPRGQVSFNGGTLQASGDTGNFLAVTTANIYGGGATIDNNGHAITIAQPLLAATGNGIASASVTSGGAGYIAPPIITITNATGDTTGTGATAIAQINRLTGAVTNVIITSPGVNYTATPIFVVSGGGATTPAVITGATPTANTSGGLTSIGLGTLTLSGANTYTGNTTISNGILALSGSGSISSTNINVTSGAYFDVSALASYSLNSGQNLEGSGYVNVAQNGLVATASGSGIYPGTDGTIGDLTINGGLTLSSGATANFDLDTTYNGANDQITVYGALTLNGNAIHIKAPSSLDNSGNDYVLITAGSISGSFSSTPVWDVRPANAANFTVVTDPVNNQVRLHYSTLASPAGSGFATPSPAVHSQNVLITVTVTNGSGTVDPNTGVVLNAGTLDGSLSSVPLVLSSTISSTVHVYTNTITVPALAAVGNYTLSAVITDSYSDVGTANISLAVTTTEVWNGGGSSTNLSWSNNPNWVVGMAPELSGDTLIFAGTVGTAPNMDNNYSVTGLTFSNNAASFTIGSTTGSTLSLAGGITNNSANAQTLNVPITLSAPQTFNAASGNIAISGVIDDSGSGYALTKTGNGALVLSATNTYTGPTLVNAGTLKVSSTGTVKSSGTTTVGNAVGNAVLLNSGSLSQLNVNVGTVSGAVGAIYQNAGDVTATQSGAGNDFQIGSAAGAYGYYYAGGGTLNVNEIGVAGEDAAGNGIMEINGSTVNDAGWFVISRTGSAQAGVLNVFSGSLSFAGGGLIANWGSGQTSIINVLGGSVNSSSAGVGLGSGTSILNLNGGLLSVNRVGSWASWGYQGNNGQVNFNGGTLQASTDSSTFLTPNSATIYSGGATIDNNGHSITIGQPLLAATGNGSASASVTSGGAGYIAPPIITITNATGDTTGTGATAIAQINRLTGAVTNVIITSPGVNYTATPIFVVSGGGATTPAVITGATPTANTSGGLTSIGTGTLTLTGANTYTGNTTVSAGTLELAQAVLATNSTVSIASGAKLQLDFSTTNIVTAILLNGVAQPSGIYNSNTVPAYITGSGSLIIPSTGPGTFTSTPGIGSFTLNGANVVLTVTDAQAGDAYYLLSSTDLSLPINQWHTVATNVAGASGSFTFTGTNVVTPGDPQQFYILSNTNYNH